MNKKELVDDVLEGRKAGHPPVSMWYHFGVQHADGDVIAKTALNYFHHYDFDFLKVMNDYFYPCPEGLDAVRTRADLKRLAPFKPEQTRWRQQFKALEIIQAALKDEAYFLDTVFDPWQSLNRSLAAENLQQLMADEPQALLEALDVIADNLIAYCKISLKIGAAGIFLSIPAGSEIVTREQFLTFVKPFVHKVLKSIQGLGRMTTLHVHGQDLFFDDVLDLPAPVFNWWDRGPGGPPMDQVLARIQGCVMGGIDQTLVARRTCSFLKQHVMEALELGGRERFFLANGCSIDTWTYPGAIETIVRTARSGHQGV